jgi:hypothetical protein
MMKTFLLATVAAFSLATGSAQAEKLIKVDSADNNWGIAYSEDRKMCNAFADFIDGTSLAFGHWQDQGIWYMAFYPAWANWFSDGEQIEVGIEFNNGHVYGVHARVEVFKEKTNKRISFQMTAAMLDDFAASSWMKLSSWVGRIDGRDYSTAFDLRGTRSAVEKVMQCQATADSKNSKPGQTMTTQYTVSGQKVVTNDTATELVSLSNLAPDETTCFAEAMTGKVVHLKYDSDGLVPVGATIEGKDGSREFVNFPDTTNMSPMATRSWIVGGLQRFFKEGSEARMTIKRCGASGRFIVLDAVGGQS